MPGSGAGAAAAYNDEFDSAIIFARTTDKADHVLQRKEDDRDHLDVLEDDLARGRHVRTARVSEGTVCSGYMLQSRAPSERTLYP